MRRRQVIAALAALGLLLTAMAPSPSLAAGVASDNVTYVTTIPFDVGGATGARLVGDHFYVAGARGFSIYDVSDPLDPQLLSTTPSGPQFPAEDVDTNGKILLLQDQQIAGRLSVWNVEDKTAPVKLAEIDGLRDHTFTCVLRCRWGYGAGGTIIDLRDPTTPKETGGWMSPVPGFGFDTTETAPGLVLTATRTIFLLDGRRDPAHPKTIAAGPTSDGRLIHSVQWPDRGRDRFILVQGETPVSQTCKETSGAFMTWDASRWRKTKSFQMIDEFRVTNGTFVDGSPPANVLGCSNLWFDAHPDFRNGGMVAAAFFEHGTRFLQVDRSGEISEIGYFMPFGGETSAAYWLTDEIVYAVDTTRGIDVLSFEG